MIWSSSSSVGWDLSDVLVDEVVDIWSNVLRVSNILLLSHAQVLESWVQSTVDWVLLSWIRSWVHAVIGIDESMNSFVNLLVTDIILLTHAQVLEGWVQSTVDSVLFSWVRGWMHAVVVDNESVNSFFDSFVSNVVLLTHT